MLQFKVRFVFIFTLFTVGAYAAKNPLDRMTPVPSNEPIPVIDFFRPRFFSNPELNPAGSHFAAIVSTKEDNHDLVCFDLVSKKVERLTGGANFDIARYDW